MGLIELFLIAVGLSMDAFAVSVCKGLAMPKCTFKKAAIVVRASPLGRSRRNICALPVHGLADFRH